MAYQYKATSLQPRDLQLQNGVVSGYLVYFNDPDRQGNVIPKGAFARTIRENGPKGNDRIKYLFEGDLLKPIGKILHLEEDSKGLAFEARISRTRLGQDVSAMYQEGLIRAHDIVYKTTKSSRHSGYTFLEEVHLWAGSVLIKLDEQEMGVKEDPYESIHKSFSLLNATIQRNIDRMNEMVDRME